jgi:hypothetical protein
MAMATSQNQFDYEGWHFRALSISFTLWPGGWDAVCIEATAPDGKIYTNLSNVDHDVSLFLEHCVINAKRYNKWKSEGGKEKLGWIHGFYEVIISNQTEDNVTITTKPDIDKSDTLLFKRRLY